MAQSGERREERIRGGEGRSRSGTQRRARRSEQGDEERRGEARREALGANSEWGTDEATQRRGTGMGLEAPGPSAPLARILVFRMVPRRRLS